MTVWLWGGFLVSVAAMMALDLGAFMGKPKVVPPKEALGWTVLWIAVALLFNAVVYVIYDRQFSGTGFDVGRTLSGSEAAIRFFTAYLVEKSLSLQNIFVIAMIFSYFRIPANHQHRVLFWGLLGALAMRGIMISAGLPIIDRFDWMTYVFGGVLIATAVKVLVLRHDNLEPERNPIVKIIRNEYSVTEDCHEEHFFAEIDGKTVATPLCLALWMVMGTGLLFAVDSVPAAAAITLDPFIVITANVFAALGLRSLYFALAAVLERFRYLKMSLVFVLAFAGVQAMMIPHYAIEPGASLGFLVGILAVGVLASFVGFERDTAPLVSPLASEFDRLSQTTVRNVHRVFVLATGSTLLLLGAALLVLPGPGMLLIIGGLAVLATEFLWAGIWLRNVRRALHEVGEESREVLRKIHSSKRP